MNTPLIITEMNKPGSIIISSSALPFLAAHLPRPSHIFVFSSTRPAGPGGVGREGLREDAASPLCGSMGQGMACAGHPGGRLCVCARTGVRAHAVSPRASMPACVRVCKHICVCAGGWAQPAGGCRAVQTPDAVSAGPPAGAGEREAEPVLRRRVTAGVSDVWLRIHARAQLCLSLCECVVHTHQHVCVWAQVCECVSVGVGLGCHVWRGSSVQGACVAANGLSGCT